MADLIQREPDIIEWIENAQKNWEWVKYANDSNHTPSGVYDPRVFKCIYAHDHIIILDEIPYIYYDGYYHQDKDGKCIKKEIYTLLNYENTEQWCNANVIARIYKLFLINARQVSYLEDYMPHRKPHCINFKNGIYDAQARRMIQHTPSYLMLYQIPHNFDPDKPYRGDMIEAWLNEIAPEPDKREMLLEYFGYCMTTDTGQQKFLFLTGEGGTGKSVVIDMLEEMVGGKNYSAVPLDQFQSRFQTFPMLGKLLNACADVKTKAIEDVANLKQATGEDTIQVEKKGVDAFPMKLLAKNIFSGNGVPVPMGEDTNAYYRRIMIFRMDKQPIKKLVNFKELLKQELPYLIKISVEALSRMYDRGVITESTESVEAVKELRIDADSVQAWINDCCADSPDEETSRGELYASYSGYCEDVDRKPKTKNGFYKSLRLKGYEEHRTTFDRYFIGITLMTDFPSKSVIKPAQNCHFEQGELFPLDEKARTPWDFS